jgi:hypothetical protein
LRIAEDQPVLRPIDEIICGVHHRNGRKKDEGVD